MKTIIQSVFAVFLILTPQTGQKYFCQLDGYEMRETGMTMITNNGKLLYEFKCLNGHSAWVVK